MNEAEEMIKWSDIIYTQITSANYTTWSDVQAAIMMLYIPDMSIPRSGISHAIKRIENEFNQLRV